MALITEATINSSQEPVVSKNVDGTFEVTIYDPPVDDLLLGIEPHDMIRYVGRKSILDEIDEDEVLAHFGLTEKTIVSQMEEEISELQRQIDDLKNNTKDNGVDCKDYIDFTQD